MEILFPLDRPRRDLKAPLRRLAASAEPLQALRGRHLPELARHLEGCPGPRVVATLLLGEALLHAGGAAEAVVSVGVDWPDYAPLRDGLPPAHYRVRWRRPGVSLSQEWRTADTAEAGRHILQALAEQSE
jgi:hypothetical protein